MSLAKSYRTICPLLSHLITHDLCTQWWTFYSQSVTLSKTTEHRNLFSENTKILILSRKQKLSQASREQKQKAPTCLLASKSTVLHENNQLRVVSGKEETEREGISGQPTLPALSQPLPPWYCLLLLHSSSVKPLRSGRGAETALTGVRDKRASETKQRLAVREAGGDSERLATLTKAAKHAAKCLGFVGREESSSVC